MTPTPRPQRLRLSRAKGWTRPAGAVVVARPTRWGNPWRVVPVRDDRFPWGEAADVVHVDGDRHAGRFERYTSGPETGAPYWAVQMYKLHLAEHPDLRAAIGAELRGRDLLCWCRPDQPCHADLLIALASSRAPVLAQPVNVHNGRPTG
jgi:Domain of unknown function (DUF4326)